MTDRLLPGAYITDGRRLFWVIERTGIDTVLIEDAVSGRELEMGEADLVGFRTVTPKETDDEQQP